LGLKRTRRRFGLAARSLAAAGAVGLCLGLSPSAHAAITSVFNQTSTPVPCSARSNGVRLCDETTFQPAQPRSIVKTFDGVPIDVRVAFPAQPSSGPDGPYPLMMVFHRYAGEKFPLQSLTGWLHRGYAAFTMTERGFGESCGTQAARDVDPAGCAKGYARFMDTRYEVRDAQELVGQLVDDGVVDPRRIGAIGNSYGGGKTTALAALRDREMLPDGSLIPWRSPHGTGISLAAAAASAGWTDLLASLVPNGSTLDYVDQDPYTGRTGVLKESFENALYAFGLPFYYAPPGSDPSADLTGWHTLLNAGEPYDDSAGNPLPAVSALRNEVTSHHSAYYIDDSEPPAPLLMVNGWTDDLFPTDEAIRLFNRTRTRYLGVPISLLLADAGHGRSQHKQADAAFIGASELAWLDYYVKGVGNPPFQGVQILTQTCPLSAPSGGPYSASSWAAAAPGEIRVDSSIDQPISPDAGSSSVSQTFDPVSGAGACATAPAADQTGTATYRSAPVPASGFTLLGSPTVVADITSRGSDSQIAARLLDVDLSADTETLVARGLWRPVTDNQPLMQVFQLHPNAYRFEAGHVVKLELLPNDNPAYGRVSNGQAEVRVSNLELRLPVLESPGALGGLVQSPAPKVLPPGYTLARDFAPAAYPRPKGATPTAVALVPAFQPCSAPNDAHGAPLSSGSCFPTAQASSNLTVGTPDSNGRAAGSVGRASFAAVPDNRLTPVDEADVRIAVSITDVRRVGDLTDYTGELEGRTLLRITDRANGTGDEAATVSDLPLRETLTCAATSGGDQGATCSVVTTVNSLFPAPSASAVQSGRRAVWELGTIEVYDGGADGLAGTTGDNELFARQGLFIP
jgi:predicted acyl esterase